MKICIKCTKKLPIEEFNSRQHKSKYTGKTTTHTASLCKACGKLVAKARRRSKVGLFTDIYNGQLLSSKTRGHNRPKYTKKELENWIKLQQNFDSLYTNWVKSNYNRWTKPSCDRLDNTKGYTLNNLRLVSFKENCDAYNRDIINGKEDSTLRAVEQYSLDMILVNTFHSIAEAARQTSSASANILRCCRQEYKTSKGSIWRYVNE